MADGTELKAALERVIDGIASETDVSELRIALRTGVVVTGERAVAIGGNASDVIIVTGDQNIIVSLRGADAAAVLAALNSIAPPRRHQVPPPPPDFTGRTDEQRELLAAIEHGGVTISGLQGMGGIGKTALAHKLADQLKQRYPDAQIYLDLKGASDQPLTAAEALAHVIRSYLPAAKLPDSEAELRALYLSVLEGQRALIVMDNAAGAAQVEPLIPPSSCVLLVTSRWHFTLPGLVAKNLDALNAADSLSLLLTIAPRIGEWANEIAKLCGYLPLALRLAAGALAKYVNLKPADYAHRLQDHQVRLELIDSSLNLSYELLSEDLRQRWRRLGVFADSFADYSAAALWEVEIDAAQQTLGELIAASMVEWNEIADRYRLHDLARLFANSKVDNEERVDGLNRHAEHYRNVLAYANTLYKEGGASLVRGLSVVDLEWANLQAGHAWVAGQRDEVDENMARLAMTYPNAAASVLELRQHPRERIRWLEIALAAARRLEDRAYEASTLGNLGLAYWSLGEVQQAIQSYEQHLTITRDLGDRRGEGNALGNLGVVYTQLGESRQAIYFNEQALIIDRELGDRRGEGTALGNLGLAYMRLGETERAMTFFKQQLSTVRETGDRREEGNAYGNLGNAYAQLGDIPRAIQLLGERLNIARELRDRRGEANALGSMGVAYAKLRETQRAIRFFEQQLIIVRETGDRRGEGHALWNISLALDLLGERGQAIHSAEQSLTIKEQVHDPTVAQVRAQIAAWRKSIRDRS